MTTQEILQHLGVFSRKEVLLFEQYTSRRLLRKHELLLREGVICQSFYFIVSGAFSQYRTVETDEVIVDLHLPGEWMFNQQSLTEQSPSHTSLKAFAESEILVLSLVNFHGLCTQSPAFLQFGKMLNQAQFRTRLFDYALSPTDKYQLVQDTKPALIQVFPLKMIASYLKITPETLSRVRAAY